MSLNLSLLSPEWAVLGVLVMLLGAEIWKNPAQKVTLQDKRSFSITSYIGAILVAMITLLSLKVSQTAFHGYYIADPLSGFFKFFFATTLVFVIPIAYAALIHHQQRLEEFYLLMWSALAGMFFLASANDLLVLFIALEIMTLSFYIMASYQTHHLRSIEAGLKYLIMGSLASAFIIFGISLIYFAVGSTNFSAVQHFFSDHPNHRLILLGLFCILSGVGFKVAAVPFQLWAPDVYEGAPIQTVAFLSVGSKAAGFLILIRLLFHVFPAFDFERKVLFSTLSALTLLYGTLGALSQRNIKRLMGYSSISHAGYMLIGIAAGERLGVSSVLYYLLSYGPANLMLFLVIILVHRASRSDEILAYNGLSKRSPFLAGCLFLSILSLAGVPGTAGFMGKFMVLLAAVKLGYGWLALLGSLGVAVSLYYYLNLIRTAYIEEALVDEPIKVPFSFKFPLLLLSAAILVLAWYPEPFVVWTKFVANTFF